MIPRLQSIFSRAAFPAFVSALILCSSGSAFADFSEGFGVAPPVGWTVNNNSSPVGSTNWFQGNSAVFSAQAGAANSYVGANFNNTTGANTISDWLITPTIAVNNGDIFSFFTRTVNQPTFPDRLEVRFSSVGGIDVGTSATDVGTFTTLLLTINGGLTNNYPNNWTQFSSTLSGLSGATSGAFAFRYFVTDGGPAGVNSDYIGIDTVSFTSARTSDVPEPTSMALLGLGLLGFAAARRRKQ